MFLIAKFGYGKLGKGAQLRQKFEKVEKKRNSLAHYRSDCNIALGIQDSQEAMELAKEVIEGLYRKVWRKTVKW